MSERYSKYQRCTDRAAAEALRQKAQQEADSILDFTRSIIGGDYTAWAYIKDHGDYYSIAGTLRENGEDTRDFDPINRMFEDAREQVILHIGRNLPDERKEREE